MRSGEYNGNKGIDVDTNWKCSEQQFKKKKKRIRSLNRIQDEWEKKSEKVGKSEVLEGKELDMKVVVGKRLTFSVR